MPYDAELAQRLRFWGWPSIVTVAELPEAGWRQAVRAGELCLLPSGLSASSGKRPPPGGWGGMAMQGITGEVAAEVIRSVLDAEGPGERALSVAVVDDAGVLLAFQRMTGAPRFSAEFAIAKARTAAAFGTETSRLEALYADRPVFAQSFVAQGGYFLGRGGVPILVEGAVVGAVGVSGADAHGEEDVARVAAGLGSRLTR